MISTLQFAALEARCINEITIALARGHFELTREQGDALGVEGLEWIAKTFGMACISDEWGVGFMWGGVPHDIG